jgi:hypothetical protein
MTVYFDGKAYTLPFPVADLPADWELNTDYFYVGDQELDPDETSSSNQYENANYDDWLYVYIGTGNYTDETVAYEDSTVRYLNVDMGWCDSDSYPDMVLPKGITWGSSLQDIYDAYGEADYVYVYTDYDGNPESVYVSYYVNGSWGSEYELEIDFEKGLTQIDIYYYPD